MAYRTAIFCGSQQKDPFDCLPPEVRLSILRHLSFEDLLTISKLCKLWKDFVDLYYSLWEVVDFQSSNGLVTACVVFNSRHKSRQFAEELYISRDEHHTGDCEDMIFGNDWTKLRRLHIESELPVFSDLRMPALLGQVTELSIHIKDSPTFVRMLLGHPLTQLRSLWLYADWYDLFKGVIRYDDVLASNVREMRELQHLRIGSADPPVNHTYPDLLESVYGANKLITLCRSGIHSLIKLFPAISRLTITRVAYSDVDDTIDSHYITNFCGLCLHTLPLEDITIKYSVLPPITITRCVNLNLFSTTVSQVFLCQGLDGVANRVNLQSLTLSNIYRLTNQRVNDILRNMGGALLTALDLSSRPDDFGPTPFYDKPADSCAPDGPIGSSNCSLARAITMSCPALRRLVVGHTAMDDALREFSNLRLLEHFEVKRSEGISPAGILGLLGMSPITAIEFGSTKEPLSSVIAPINSKLKSIAVRDCSNVYPSLLKPLERFGISIF
ncbi:uncharacterized protein V1513DRAFT_245912 [Lipomyces chichibuensis]|uniref:uncharacterized protein n=1 Tax=Lipomyces chichibuensis TaxID=1546026 RepID=UPI0033433018